MNSKKFSEEIKALQFRKQQLAELATLQREVEELEAAHFSSSADGQALNVILGEVCREFGADRGTLLGKSRTARFVLPRHAVFYLAVEQGVTLSSIGRLMNRDHCSVAHGARAIEDRISSDPVVAARIEKLQQVVTSKLVMEVSA